MARMSNETQQKAVALLAEMADLGPVERFRLLEERCKGDLALRREVEALLTARKSD